ncbi:Lrp/AsnC family transcriptional regulator [Deinococcus misasensis]|uniref:Lrp/AsnC family transcriptional regulator n=1 Tax=Deinococcus misasensis TaxID=392413 RepID=UPI00054D41BD|nr:Lrp/AsnC family transcriptional regulator [Deinococcus misasensis]
MTPQNKTLDDVSWKLLDLLQQDARMSYKDLARHVGLTAPAVAERLKKLEDAGIIRGYKADLDLAALGRPLIGFIRLSATGDKFPFLDHITENIPEALEFHRITGGDSYMLKVAVRDMGHLESVLDRLSPYCTPITSLVISSPLPARVIKPLP